MSETSDDSFPIFGCLFILFIVFGVLITAGNAITSCTTDEYKRSNAAQLEHHLCIKQSGSDELTCRYTVQSKTGVTVSREDGK